MGLDHEDLHGRRDHAAQGPRLLSLDDPIVKYVPELRQVYNPYGPMDDVTLRMLMSHSAGFRNPTWPWGGDQDWHPFEPPGWEQVSAMLPYTKIEFPRAPSTPTRIPASCSWGV